MKCRQEIFLFWFFFAAFCLSSALRAEADISPLTLSLFVDWAEAPVDFLDFLKGEMPWVTCARDRADARVFVLIVSQATGSGGREYQIHFIGQHDFAGLTDTVRVNLAPQISEDHCRRQIVQRIKLGLARYLVRLPSADAVRLEAGAIPAADQARSDGWHHWVFSISFNGNVSGEQSQLLNYLWGAVKADRITERWKINTALQGTYKYNRYELDSVTTYIDTSHSYSAWCRLVRGLDQHWSVGGGPSFKSSTFSNLQYRFGFDPGLEYSILPYDEAATREVKFAYNLGYAYQRYYETTIFGKTGEYLCYQGLSFSVDTKQPWGSVFLSLNWSNYFHDFTKNNLNLYINTALNLIRGLSVNVWGSAGLIHDQLHLSRRGLTPEEILLQIREMSSRYEYWGGFGLTYSFGSRFSRVVNTRFD